MVDELVPELAIAPAAALGLEPVTPDEATLPRWRRPSLKAARLANDRKPVETVPLAFAAAVTASAAERRRVRYAVVPLVDAPDEIRSTEIGQLQEGDEVELLSSEGRWMRVRTPVGTIGWVHKTTLAPLGSRGTRKPGEEHRRRATTMPDGLRPARRRRSCGRSAIKTGAAAGGGADPQAASGPASFTRYGLRGLSALSAPARGGFDARTRHPTHVSPARLVVRASAGSTSGPRALGRPVLSVATRHWRGFDRPRAGPTHLAPNTLVREKKRWWARDEGVGERGEGDEREEGWRVPQKAASSRMASAIWSGLIMNQSSSLWL